MEDKPRERKSHALEPGQAQRYSSAVQARSHDERSQELADRIWRGQLAAGVPERCGNLQLFNELVVSVRRYRMIPYVQGSIPKGRYNHASASLFGNSVIIFGGKTQHKGKNN